MTDRVHFKHSYMSFPLRTEPYQRADDVGYAMTELLWHNGKPFYPVTALAEARYACARLAEGRFDETDEDNIDLILQMRRATGGYFFEIILRNDKGTAYGGWAWGQELSIGDEIHDGYRVLTTHNGRHAFRFAWDATTGRYRCLNELPVSKSGGS
ncbi:hypothetical protein SAMN05880590_1058 [Rhizobium sp. RU35A]|uniref:hypothetical protein n=1 Tax=Rhizobium sp. RU35A TaxID=1907414 RepID=UPI0009565D80|nr:hypothetical protein [Rhizobium sp. RU35A]SIQ52611.1 hypothetical protein SAMN05880590_1058 [Rhizobium sp. RU35A]